jgi:hypothetical protein
MGGAVALTAKPLVLIFDMQVGFLLLVLGLRITSDEKERGIRPMFKDIPV